MAEEITISATVKAPLEKAWDCFTNPAHIVNWYIGSTDWHTPTAVNDLQSGGTFDYRMEAVDKSAGFNFTGVYTEVVPMERIAYTITGGRKVRVSFQDFGGEVQVSQTIETETENTVEKQKDGWQNIFNNYRRYVESE